MTRMTCSFCPMTKSIEDLRKNKKNDPNSTENIETKTVALNHGGGEDKETRFQDIIDDIDDRYPNWKTTPIIVPAYIFSGIENKKTWTEEDLYNTLSEERKKFISTCNLRAVETGPIPPDLGTHLNEHMKENFQSYISQYNIIRGRKCEQKVRNKNLKKLKTNAAGLNLSNIHHFKYLYHMLSKFGIDIVAEIKKKKKNPKLEIESDSIFIRPHGDHIKVEIQEIKAYSVDPSWRGASYSHGIGEKSDEYFKNNVKRGLEQLKKGVTTFTNIFSFLTDEELKRVRLTARCIFPNFSKKEIHNSDVLLPCHNCSALIQLKEDFESSCRTYDSMFSPFNQTNVMDIYKKILAIYIGVGSMIELKTPEDGYKKEKADLEQVSNMMFNNRSRIIMLGAEQMKIVYQRLKNDSLRSGILMGPYGSGKTLAILFLLQRVQLIIEDEESSEKKQVIIIIWDDKAKDLLKYYQDQNPAPDGKIYKKSEAFKHFGILDDNIHRETTTIQINQLCKAIKEKSAGYEETYLFIDEVLVDTCEQDLLGNAPFVHNGQPVDWSGLDPLDIITYIAVTPDSECFLNPKEYSEVEIRENNKRSLMTTNVLSRSYRSNISIQEFIQFIQSELKEEGLTGFNPEPRDVCSGHEIVGTSPEWSPCTATQHMMCNRGCKHCFLDENILKKINYFLKDVPQTIRKKEVVIVVIENLINRRRYKGHEYSRLFVKSWFEKKGFSSSQIKFDFEFEGMESSVMILIQNLGDMSGSLSNVLSRAISRLLLLSPKDDKYLEAAVSANHLTIVPVPYVDDGYGDSTINNEKETETEHRDSPEDIRIGGTGGARAYETIQCLAPLSDSDQSMPDLDSDAFSSSSSDETSSSSSEEEEYRLRAFQGQNLGTFEIYPSYMVLKRSKSITDMKNKSEQISSTACRSMEDLVESGSLGESICYFTLLEDIANIFIEKPQFFP